MATVIIHLDDNNYSEMTSNSIDKLRDFVEMTLDMYEEEDHSDDYEIEEDDNEGEYIDKKEYELDEIEPWAAGTPRGWEDKRWPNQPFTLYDKKVRSED